VCTGARSAEHVVRNAALFAIPIPDELWSDLSSAGLVDPSTPFPTRASIQ